MTYSTGTGNSVRLENNDLTNGHAFAYNWDAELVYRRVGLSDHQIDSAQSASYPNAVNWAAAANDSLSIPVLLGGTRYHTEDAYEAYCIITVTSLNNGGNGNLGTGGDDTNPFAVVEM